MGRLRGSGDHEVDRFRAPMHVGPRPTGLRPLVPDSSPLEGFLVERVGLAEALDVTTNQCFVGEAAKSGFDRGPDRRGAGVAAGALQQGVVDLDQAFSSLAGSISIPALGIELRQHPNHRSLSPTVPVGYVGCR